MLNTWYLQCDQYLSWPVLHGTGSFPMGGPFSRVAWLGIWLIKPKQCPCSNFFMQITLVQKCVAAHHQILLLLRLLVGFFSFLSYCFDIIRHCSSFLFWHSGYQVQGQPGFPTKHQLHWCFFGNSIDLAVVSQACSWKHPGPITMIIFSNNQVQSAMKPFNGVALRIVGQRLHHPHPLHQPGPQLNDKLLAIVTVYL